MANSTELKGKTAFVTGGSSGIGAATVTILAEAGCAVMIGYHSGVERAEQLKDRLPGTGHAVAQVDIRDPASIDQAIALLDRQFGKLDILVNSAGTTRPIPHRDLDALDEHLFDDILLTNARGPYSVTRRALPLLTRSGDAVVVNISSVSGFTGSGSNIAYCAAKAALDTMTKSFARVFGPEVRFLCVSPASVATDFVAGRDRAALEAKAENIPLKRVVEPEDVARAVFACVSHLRTATGTRIVIDAGHTL